MSLLIAVPCAIGAALAYGASNAVQHSAVNNGAGTADAGRLIGLLRNPRWLASVAGDTVGLILQIVALATGPVVLIAPILVLAVPVSLPVGWLLGGPRPSSGNYLACAAILVGLGIFAGLIGHPRIGRPIPASSALLAIVVALLLGALAFVLTRHCASGLRAGVLGGVSGAGFGLVGVLLNATTSVVHDGRSQFLTSKGLVPLFGAIVVGLLAMTTLQISFQVGSLAASFPANESAAPVVAVLLGSWLLHEHVPVGGVHVPLYLVSLVLVVLGTVKLAQRDDRAAVRVVAGTRV